jgi:preprotein translocase subunit SecG
LAVADESMQPVVATNAQSNIVAATGSSKVVTRVGFALVVVVAGIAIGLRFSSNSAASASSTVRGALVSALANHTATLSIAESIDVEGQIGTATGRARCDLRVDACSATLDYHGALAQLGTESMVYSNRTMYLKLAGTVGASFPTPWIWLPFKASNRPSALGSTGSPLAGLALLTRNGAVLKDDGTVIVDGTEMHQFVVDVTKSNATSVVSRHEPSLPPWLAEPESLGPLGASSVTLDLTAAGRIGRIKFTTTARQDGTFATVRATETVTSYGAPVTITVPAKKQLTFVDALAGTLTRYCAPPPGLRLGPSSKPIVTRH